MILIIWDLGFGISFLFSWGCQFSRDFKKDRNGSYCTRLRHGDYQDYQDYQITEHGMRA
jgi:hypothetical protein